MQDFKKPNSEKKNSNSIFFKILFCIFFLLTTLFFLLPSLASTHYAKQKIENYLKAKFHHSFQLTDLQFSFLGGQTVDGLVINIEDLPLTLRMQKLHIDASFPSLLFFGINQNQIHFEDFSVAYNKWQMEPLLLSQINGSLRLTPFNLKMEGISEEGGTRGSFNFDLALNNIGFKNFEQLIKKPEELLSSPESSFTAQINDFPVALLDLLLSTFKLSPKETLISEFLGPKLNLILDKSLEKDNIEESFSSNLTLTVSSSNLEGALDVKIGRDLLFLTKPSHFLFRINQNLMNHFTPKDFNFTLSEDSYLGVNIDAFSIPFNSEKNEFNLKELMLNGKVESEGAKFVSQSDKNEGEAHYIYLKKLIGILSTDEKSDTIFLKIDAKASEDEEPIKIALETHLNKSLDFKSYEIPPMFFELTHIPVKALDHFFNLNELLSVTLGSHLDLKIEALLKKNHTNLNIGLNSPLVSLSNVRFKIDDYITMKEPAHIFYKLNDSSFTQFEKNHPYFSLGTKTALELSFFIDPISRNIHSEFYSGILKIPHFLLNVKDSNESLALNNINVSWELQTPSKKATFQIFSETKGSHDLTVGSLSCDGLLQRQDDGLYLFNINLGHQKGEDKKRSLQLSGEAGNIFKEDGSLDTKGLSLHVEGSINHLPTQFSCQVVGFEKSLSEKMEILFGRNLNADIHLNLKKERGPIKLEVRGEVGSLELDSFTEEGFLFLKKPFNAKFTVSPRLGKSILLDLFPLLGGVQDSDQPIEIGIDSEGFSFPLADLDLTKIEIPKAFLSLGHLRFDNSGELANVLSLLTPSHADLITVWFTPLYFTMHEGVFNLQRVDLLISNQFPMAAWGKVNLVKDKVRMKIGVSGEALSHAFKVQDLDSHFMLQIPFTGTLKSASIDKKTATARIGALVAKSHGGPKGLVLGTVLSLAGGALSEKRVPQPTTVPLPWAELFPEKREGTGVESKDTKKEAEPVRNELKQEMRVKTKRKKLKKGIEQELNNQADKLFDKIFK